MSPRDAVSSADAAMLPAAPVLTSVSVAADEAAEQDSLGLVGRVVIAVALTAGVAVAATSGIGLIWFIPYGGVGAILAIRRPKNPIGWILLAMAWAHALTVLPIDATVQQFDVGPPPVVALAAVVSSTSALTLFPLYALLAFVFPSGTLPRGRWGMVSRFELAAMGLVAVLSLVAPTISANLPGHPAGVPIRNPLALAPDLPIWPLLVPGPGFVVILGLLVTAVVSLVIRARAARGIERQQVRWVAGALVLVAVCILAALVIGALVPGSANEAAVLPAILAFATVPLAIGIAVLRYRLYEIDTIINRAIVYGLLTAILAGASTAAIGVLQNLFQGVIGPGSDVTIVLTTLVVVSAFNPIKARLETAVDRRFKRASDPVASLQAFTDEVRGSLSRPDRDRTIRRLLDLAVAEFLAKGAEVRWTGADAKPRVLSAGARSDEPVVTTYGSAGDGEVNISVVGAADPGSVRRAQWALQRALIAAFEETAST